jgi:hypothetical protein
VRATCSFGQRTKTHSILGFQAMKGFPGCLMPLLRCHLLYCPDSGRLRELPVTSRSFPAKKSIRLLYVGVCFSFLYTMSHVRITVLSVANASRRISRPIDLILRTFSKVPSRHIGDHLGGNLCKVAHLYLRRIVLFACGSTRTTSFRLVFAGCLGHCLPW